MKKYFQNNIVFSWVLLCLFSLPSSSNQGPSEEDIRRILNNKPGEVSWTENQKPKGVVEYSMQVKDCSSGTCNVIANRHWRQSKGFVYIDGHYFLAETLDKFDGNGYPVLHNQSISAPQAHQGIPKRIEFSVGLANPGPRDENPDFSSIQNIKFNYNNSLLNTLNELLPSVFTGLKNGIEDLNRSLAISKQLHDGYLSSLNQNKKFIELNEKQAQQTREDSVFNSGMAAVVLSQLQGLFNTENMGTAGLEKIKTLKEFQESQKNPFIVKEYEMSEESRKKAVTDFIDAIGEGKIRKAVAIAEVLLNQKDPSSQALNEAALAEYAPNGIINIETSIRNQLPGPLDSFKPKTKIATVSGQLVRRIANQAQSAWVETNNFKYSSDSRKALFVASLGVLAQADEDLGYNNTQAGFAALDLARSLLDCANGFVHGLGTGLVDTVKALPNLAKLTTEAIEYSVQNPKKSIENAYDLILTTPKLGRLVLIYTVGKGFDFIIANSQKRGEMLGDITSNVLLGYLTGEAASIVRSAAKGVKAEEVLTKSMQGLKSLIASDDLAAALNRNTPKLLLQAGQFSKERMQGFRTLLKTSPQSTENALRLMGVGENQLLSQSQAGEFLGKVIAANTPGLSQIGFVEKLLLKYNEIENALVKMPKTTINEEVWRGISKTAVIDSKTVQMSLDDVFKLHRSNKLSDHRFSIGGPEGEMALYTTRGEKQVAISTIKKETKKSEVDLIISSQQVQSNKVLDLTNKSKLQELGLLEYINEATRNPLHLEGQIIGNIARKNGFEVIIVPSYYNNGGINVILLK